MHRRSKSGQGTPRKQATPVRPNDTREYKRHVRDGLHFGVVPGGEIEHFE